MCTLLYIEWVINKDGQSCLTLCNLMDCSPLGPSVHAILQARMLEWVAIPFSMGSSRSRDWTQGTWDSCIAGGFFTFWATREAQSKRIYCVAQGTLISICDKQYGKVIWKRIYVCVSITKSHCCTSEKNTALQIKYTPIWKQTTKYI